MSAFAAARAFAARLARDVGGASFLEYVILVALGVGAVAAGVTTLTAATEPTRQGRASDADARDEARSVAR